MHPEADALLDAIFDNPDDDTPRLVYADWLQDHNQTNYAEFIRLQCAVAHYRIWSAEANDLWVKIGRVWSRLTGEWWCWPLLDEFNLDASDFHRGFLRRSFEVEEAEELGEYLRPGIAPAIFARVGVRFFHFSYPQDFPERDLNWLRQVRELAIYLPEDEPSLDVFYARELPHLRQLDLRATLVTERIGRVLLSVKGLSHLHRILLPPAHTLSESTIVDLRQRFGEKLIFVERERAR